MARFFRRKFDKIKRTLFQLNDYWNLINTGGIIDHWSLFFGNYHFNTILDIGANEGQFAKRIRKIYSTAQIYSFEPIPHVYEILESNFVNDPHHSSFNCALGNTSGETTFYLNEFTPSSSLLKMADHKKHFENARNEKAVPVAIEKLDEIRFDPEIKFPLLIKIDVQGFELEVVKGGQAIVQSADIILVETSFKELYQGQTLFQDTYEMLTRLGFRYIGNIEQMFSPESGEILQADAVFERTRKEK